MGAAARGWEGRAAVRGRDRLCGMDGSYPSDFVQGIRGAWHGRPQVSVVAVVVLALAIGANTATFSVLEGVLLRPLPYLGAERIVSVWRFVLTAV